MRNQIINLTFTLRGKYYVYKKAIGNYRVLNTRPKHLVIVKEFPFLFLYQQKTVELRKIESGNYLEFLNNHDNGTHHHFIHKGR
jgi:hypothetical protein